MLDFHHIDPSIKSFCLSAGEMVNMALAKVLAEMKKCVLLCCRCHREVEAGLYSAEEINNLYHEKWSNIHIS